MHESDMPNHEGHLLGFSAHKYREVPVQQKSEQEFNWNEQGFNWNECLRLIMYVGTIMLVFCRYDSALVYEYDSDVRH